MKHADPGEIEALVADVVRASPLAGDFRHVHVSTGDFDDGSEFLRILVFLNGLDGQAIDGLDAVMSSIEGTVSEHDDRLPSVRFSEPE